MLALGLAWYVLELGMALAGGVRADAAEVARAWLRLLPWQLALFAALGLALAVLARALSLSATAFGWLALFAACFAFVGARVAEGAFRTGGARGAASAVSLLAVGLAAGFATLAAVGRWLPPALRRAWSPALWVALSLVVLPFVRRAGPAIGLGEVPIAAWPGFVSAPSLGAALLGGVAVLAAGAVGAGRSTAICLAVGLAAIPPAAKAAPPDVVLVLVDALRDDHVGAQRGAASLTPQLDAIAAQGVRFARAYAPANVTRRAMPGVLISSTERVVGAPLAPEAQPLALLLQRAGYATVGVSANPFVSAHTGYDRGFDVFSDPSDAPGFAIGSLLQLLFGVDRSGAGYRLGLAGSDLYYEPGERLFARGLRLFAEARRPAFLYLHEMDVHGPYLPPHRLLPPEYDAAAYLPYSQFLRLSPDEVASPAYAAALTNTRQRYAAGVRCADEQIGKLRAALEAQGRWDEALVWITADHGEALGELGFVGHGVATLAPVLTQVPLILKPPRSWGIAARVVEQPVSTFDILPTTLTLLGLAVPTDVFGSSVAELARGGSAPAERDLVSWNITPAGDDYAVVRGPWQLVLRIAPDGRRERQLHRIDADPLETRDFAIEEADLAAQLEASVDAYREREALLSQVRAPGGFDAETRARLRALGYVDDRP